MRAELLWPRAGPWQPECERCLPWMVRHCYGGDRRTLWYVSSLLCAAVGVQRMGSGWSFKVLEEMGAPVRFARIGGSLLGRDVRWCERGSEYRHLRPRLCAPGRRSASDSLVDQHVILMPCLGGEDVSRSWRVFHSWRPSSWIPACPRTSISNLLILHSSCKSRSNLGMAQAGRGASRWSFLDQLLSQTAVM